MKYFVFSILFVLAISARAQITLEHTYFVTPSVDFQLDQVDSGIWKYVYCNKVDSIVLFNLDHSVDRTIKVPWPSVNSFSLTMLTKHLFDLDGNYEYLVQGPDNPPNNWNMIRIFREDGTLDFACDSCIYAYIENTNEGAKMLISRSQLLNQFQVYSLPGKLPSCQTYLASVNPSVTNELEFVPTSAYPNPTSGQIRIAYQLPMGTFSGEIVVTSEAGAEMKRYRVTNAFSDLLIDGSEFPSGSYFYKVVTDKGNSSVGKFTIDR